MNKYLSPREIGEEAREALRRAKPADPKELFRRLVQRGWINANGEVTKLLGGEADLEPTATIEQPTCNGKGITATDAKN